MTECVIVQAAMEKALSDRAALFGQQGADGAAEGSIEATGASGALRSDI